MPKDKTRRLFTPLVLFFGGKALQVRYQANRDQIPCTECSCTAAAILAKMRGQPVPLCHEMPWLCPLAGKKSTPIL